MNSSIDSSRLARRNRPAFRGLLTRETTFALRRRLHDGKDRLVKNLIYAELLRRRRGQEAA